MTTTIPTAPPLPKQKRRPRASTIILTAALAVTTLTLGAVIVTLSVDNTATSEALSTARADLAGIRNRMSVVENSLANAQDLAETCSEVALELHDQLSVMIDDVVIPLVDGAKAGALSQYAIGTTKISGATSALDGLTARVENIGPDYLTCTR